MSEDEYFPISATDGSKDGPLVIVEGKDNATAINAATGYGCLYVVKAFNLLNVGKMAKGKRPDCHIIIAANYELPSDQYPLPGGMGFALAIEAARAIDAALAVPRREGHDKLSFNELANLMGLDEVANQVMSAPKPDALPESKSLRAVNLGALLKMNIPPRGHVLFPIIPQQGLVMVHAMRGIGKTYFALVIAFAVASGGCAFGRWKADKPWRVLYIDGEMALWSMQQRLAGILQANINALPEGDNPLTENLHLINPDMQPDFIMPNLATAEGQKLVEPYVDAADLIIIDNLATLARTGKANSEDEWWPVQGWLLSLRRRGKSALLVHHEGKSGTQRGTSAKEDILDVVIRLARPADYEPDQGARFSVTLTKARGIIGADAEPFEAMLQPDGTWSTKAIEETQMEQIRQLASAGQTMRSIADELHISLATVCRKCQEYGIKTKGHGGK